MLKKISHIVLSSLLLVTTTGLTFSKHYCGNELKSVSLFSEAKSCCGGPCNCCHNESFTVKVSDDFSAASCIFDFTQFAFKVPATLPLFFDVVNEPSEKWIAKTDIPPPPIRTVLSSLQTYLL
jgi:hypothetical protein